MRMARSLEAAEGPEAGHGRQHRGSTQTRFPEEEGSDAEVAWIAEKILAKLGPEFRQSRDPKRRPPTPGLQRVRSVEREASPPASKDTCKNKNADKTGKRNRRRSPSTDRSRSRNWEGPPPCYKCKGYGHFMQDCPSSDFYAVGWMDESGLYSAFNHSWSYHRLQVVGVYVLDPSCTSPTCGQSF